MEGCAASLWYTDSRIHLSSAREAFRPRPTERPRVLKDTSMSTVSVKAVAAATGIVACAAYYSRGGNPVRLVRAQSNSLEPPAREETMMGDGLFFCTSRGLHYVSPPPAPAAPAARISSTPTEHVLEQLPCGTMVMVSRNP